MNPPSSFCRERIVFEIQLLDVISCRHEDLGFALIAALHLKNQLSTVCSNSVLPGSFRQPMLHPPLSIGEDAAAIRWHSETGHRGRVCT